MDKNDHRPSDAQKLHFLRSRLARPTEASGLAPLVETHMSWVVLGADEVLKLRKPVRYPFLDFSKLVSATRRRNCT